MARGAWISDHGMFAAERLIRQQLERADILVGGQRPWDIHVHDQRAYRETLGRGTLGAGEAWMNGWFDCSSLDQMIERLYVSGFVARLHKRPQLASLWSFFFNYQSRRRAFQVGRRHYDIGNDLYSRMLDRRMIYSCGWWSDGATDLDQAQEKKLELVARKLDLKPGMKVLDIGCGWGGAAAWYADHYGVQVCGITVSKQQWLHAQETWGQSRNVEFFLLDYRDLK